VGLSVLSGVFLIYPILIPPCFSPLQSKVEEDVEWSVGRNFGLIESFRLRLRLHLSQATMLRAPLERARREFVLTPFVFDLTDRTAFLVGIGGCRGRLAGKVEADDVEISTNHKLVRCLGFTEKSNLRLCEVTPKMTPNGLRK
jgi:hypothetical protein